MKYFQKNTYGVISNGSHVDVSNTERGAKCYATRNGFDTVTIRFKGGYIVQEIAKKQGKKWINIA